MRKRPTAVQAGQLKNLYDELNKLEELSVHCNEVGLFLLTARLNAAVRVIRLNLEEIIK